MKAMSIWLVLVLAFLVAFSFVMLRFYFPVASKGNSRKYNPRNIRPIEGSALEGKTIYVIGSSVTMGVESFHISFTDYLERRNRCKVIRNAVTSSTLSDTLPRSYLSRLEKDLPNVKPDIAIIQLSTNDTVFRRKIGMVQNSLIDDVFDRKETIGALELMISKIKRQWGCRILIMTNPWFDNPYYSRLIFMVYEVCRKWDVEIIDLYNDKDFNDITKEQRSLYMNDSIHPTKAGYLLWLTPEIERHLSSSGSIRE